MDMVLWHLEQADSSYSVPDRYNDSQWIQRWAANYTVSTKKTI